MTTRISRAWVLALTLAAGVSLLTATSALADRDRDDRGGWRGSNSRDGRHEDHGWGRGRSADRRRDDRVDFRVELGSRPRNHHPSPVVVVPQRARRWVPGRYETRTERVLVREGYYVDRYIPAVIERRRDHCGRPYDVVVEPARCEQVWVPAQYEVRATQVFVPGCWVEDPCATPAPIVYSKPPRHEQRSGVSIRVGGRFEF